MSLDPVFSAFAEIMCLVLPTKNSSSIERRDTIVNSEEYLASVLQAYALQHWRW